MPPNLRSFRWFMRHCWCAGLTLFALVAANIQVDAALAAPPDQGRAARVADGKDEPVQLPDQGRAGRGEDEPALPPPARHAGKDWAD